MRHIPKVNAVMIGNAEDRIETALLRLIREVQTMDLALMLSRDSILYQRNHIQRLEEKIHIMKLSLGEERYNLLFPKGK